MGRVYYTIGDKEVIINYPIDASGHYLIEWEGKEIGHLFVDGVKPNSHTPIWKGTTTCVNLFADELGAFIERSAL
ncbi:MAG TPA: hypothetical protein VGC08_08380 [Pedobacter sp.]